MLLNNVPSSSTNLIVYWFIVLVYVAVYVASPSTSFTSLSQPANVYVYWAVLSFDGVCGNTTSSP